MSLFFRYLLLVVLGLAAAVAAAADGEPAQQVYLVSFAEAPLASYRGGSLAPGRRDALKATSPATTGRPLDVDAPAARDYRDHLGALRGKRLAAAERRLGRPLTPAFVYDVVNNAVALSLTAAEAEALAGLDGVALVERERISELQGDAGPQWIGADAVWSADGGLGTRGAGRVVAIIDSGINRSHPAFAAVGPVDGHHHANPRGRFYGQCQASPSLCNAKLIGIHDFTLCTGQHNSTGCKDEEPNDARDQSGHGSHVAATAVGNVLHADLSARVAVGEGTVRFSGVAPHASLIAYKACEVTARCRGSWLLAAINQAVADGVDVINYSIGAEVDNPWTDSDARAMLSARDANVLVVTSAGNSGPGEGTVTSPADAPWVFAVANGSHDRVIANRLLDLSGGAHPPPAGGVLIGAGLTQGHGPAPLVVPADHPGCSVGSGDTTLPPTGESNPWSPGRFSGEIVVCRRGTQARVAKSNNVRLAGGGGMVLVNTAADGESVVADEHGIPSTHLGFSAGRALTDWLATGSGQRGRIEGARIVRDPNLGDRLHHSSSRGPVAAGDFLKPAVAAPGTSVLSAAGSGNGFELFSGTSMASPHVAGAMALLRAARPTWSVADIESALVTTAQPALREADGVTPATTFMQGAGRVDLGAALRAGLGFPVTRAEFEAANPASGGDSRALNQPAMIHGRCVNRCSVTRRVRDIAGGGTWRAEFSGVDGLAVTVTPQQFTLAPGATQSLAIEAVIGSPALLGRWAEGRIRLRRVDAGGALVSDAHVPVAVFAAPGALPTRLDVAAAAERGHADFSVGGLLALTDLRVRASVPAQPQRTARQLAADPTRNDPYDNVGTGSFVTWLEVPATATPRPFRIVASAQSATARDVDLFAGVDSNRNDAPDGSERRCRSIGFGASERCEFELASATQPQRVWVLAQNREAGASGSDQVVVETVLADSAPAPGLSVVATAASRVATDGSVPVRLAWDLPDLLPGQQRLSQLLLAVGDEEPFARIPLWISRGSTAAPAPRVLRPGHRQRVDLAAGAAQDRLVIDVPSNAGALVVHGRTAGAVDLHAARIATPAGPAIEPAPPRGQAQASAVGGSGDKQLRIAGAQLQAGRWYLTPVNTGSQPVSLELEVEIEYASARLPLDAGAYFNPARSGAGAFVYPIGADWGFIWYTYLQDGTPTWYLGAAPAPTAQQGVWRVPLERYVWNGTAAVATTVGEAVLAFGEPEAFQFGWNLDGQSGSERYERIDTGPCPAGGLDATGIWFSPERPGFGYSINVGAGIETYAAYFYDAQGIARWLFGAAMPLGVARPVPLPTQVGACPLCSYQAPATVASGTLQRSYAAGGASGRIGVDFAWPAPLSGSWQVELPAVRMTDPVGCR
jgi:subtilisin family serine protease